MIAPRGASSLEHGSAGGKVSSNIGRQDTDSLCKSIPPNLGREESPTELRGGRLGTL